MRRFFLLVLAFIVSLTPVLAQASIEQRRVLVVLVFDQNCKAWCAKVRPVMKELEQEFGDKVKFSELDSTDSVLPDTKKLARELGILGAFKDVMDYVPVVLIFDRRIRLVKELTGPKNKDVYRAGIDKALAAN